MYENKKELIKAITPKAILMPLTKKAEAATAKSQCQKGIISIMEFPFRVGRESRVGENSMGSFLKFRIKKTDAHANNDIYLVDEEGLQISKEHFSIEKTNNFYLLKDRGSNTGTSINDITYGAKTGDEEQVLNDGDIIKIGSPDSEYKYQFVVLD